MGTELFHMDGHTDRQTDMKKLIVAFRNFANAHKKSTSNAVSVCVILLPPSELSDSSCSSLFCSRCSTWLQHQIQFPADTLKNESAGNLPQNIMTGPPKPPCQVGAGFFARE
jgi:hypothetical protein